MLPSTRGASIALTSNCAAVTPFDIEVHQDVLHEHPPGRTEALLAPLLLQRLHALLLGRGGLPHLGLVAGPDDDAAKAGPQLAVLTAEGHDGGRTRHAQALRSRSRSLLRQVHRARWHPGGRVRAHEFDVAVVVDTGDGAALVLEIGLQHLRHGLNLRLPDTEERRHEGRATAQRLERALVVTHATALAPPLRRCPQLCNVCTAPHRFLPPEEAHWLGPRGVHDLVLLQLGLEDIA
mmetsp:Transcript_15427/g.48648  ORF Transcript_15427/g.48648 Transcript_15427/m.48648 type:complete len:236 (-) Transcript_15427:568-1275(-)